MTDLTALEARVAKLERDMITTATFTEGSRALKYLKRHPVLMHVTYNDRSSADCCHDVSRVPVTFCPECGERLPRREPLRGD